MGGGWGLRGLLRYVSIPFSFDLILGLLGFERGELILGLKGWSANVCTAN